MIEPFKVVDGTTGAMDEPLNGLGLQGLSKRERIRCDDSLPELR